MSGIVSLAIVFATITVVAMHNVGNTVLLVGLATTLPRQIEMTYELHLLASGWNDFIAIWTRFGGVAANMLPQPDPDFDKRIKFDRLVLREGDHANVVSSLGDAVRIVLAQPTGRINVRGGNGAGKSSLLGQPENRDEANGPIIGRPPIAWRSSSPAAWCRSRSKGRRGRRSSSSPESMDQKLGFSSGERQLKSLQEIVNATDAEIYLLDEWDANLDAANKAKADALVDELAARARVVEISHRDRAV